MLELDAANVIEYLRRTGRLEADRPATAEWLAWGVSNVVLRVRREGDEGFVVKQSREQLRTQAAWFSRLDRIWREAALMRSLRPLLPQGFVPQVLFEDRENYLFAMQAVPDGHVVWKAELLSGRLDASIAECLGEALARLHVGTLDNHELREQFGDRKVFVQLRIDPFYRTLAQAHPQLRGAIERMIDETLATPSCIVHGDFSPKNVLVWGAPALALRQLTLVDYETGHYGDPAFDIGFFLSHLLLKAVRDEPRRREFINLAQTFWLRYEQTLHAERHGPLTFPGDPLADKPPVAPHSVEHNRQIEIDRELLERRAIPHVAGCMLARIDGTSPVDYLPDESQRARVRDFSRDLFLNPPAALEETFQRLGAKSRR